MVHAEGGEAMVWLALYTFFRRKVRVALLALAIYMSLC